MLPFVVERFQRSGFCGSIATLGGLLLGLCVAPAPADPGTLAAAPASLAETGLYADFSSRTLAAGVEPFAPQYPLWSDGATKRRWILLPAGTAIDGSDPEAWVFPVGTRIWKEFAFDRRIETRYMERTASGAWLYATYRWNEAETEARLAPVRGVKRAAESRPGVPYALPSVADCRACHESAGSPVLGFSALQLSSDRDPMAPHATLPEPGSLDLAGLLRRGLVVGLPESIAAHAPRVRAATATARAALGYLHGNCAHCHNPRSPIANLGLFLDVKLDGTCEALGSAVGHESQYRPTGTAIESRIVPGNPAASLLIARVASREPPRQMPPLGTRLVDEEALALLTRWVAEELAPQPVVPDGSTATSLAPESEVVQEIHP